MSAAIVGNGAVAGVCQEDQLFVPGVGVQWPAVAHNNWLPFAPIFVVDLRSIFGSAFIEVSPWL